jgi:hypothetical protein
MYNAKEKIDVQKELNAVSDFLQSRWDFLDKFNVDEMLQLIWDKGLEYSKNRIDPNKFTDKIIYWTEERESYASWKKAGTPLSSKEVADCINYDAIYKFTSKLVMAATRYEKMIMKNWDYSETCEQIMKEIKEAFPLASKAKPTGWIKFGKTYTDYAGMTEYANGQSYTDVKDFQGANSSGASHFDFTTRVALPHVMYGDKCQGRSALETLIGAVFAQAIFTATHNNNVDFVTEIKNHKEELNKPEYYQSIQRVVEVEGTNPVSQAIFYLAKDHNPLSVEEFASKLDRLKQSNSEFEYLPEGERKDKLAVNSAEISNLITNLMKEVNNPQNKEAKNEASAYEIKKANDEKMVWEILNTSGKMKNKM